MGLITLIDRLFGRPGVEASKNTAKDRLRLVLMHDRTDIPATMMEAIRMEMVQVLSKYVEIDQEALEVQLAKEDGSIGLVLNIPIRRVKTEAEAKEALATTFSLMEGKRPSEPPSAPTPAPAPVVAPAAEAESAPDLDARADHADPATIES